MEEQVEKKNEIVSFIESTSIAESKKQAYISLLTTYISKINEYETSVDNLIIENVNDTDKMKEAREGRLILKNMRIACAEILTGKRKDVQKEMESFTTEDQTLLKLTQKFNDSFSRLEKKLLDKEKFAELEEERRKAKLKSDREKLIEPYKQYGINPDMYDLANMPEDAFEITFSGIEATAKKRIEEAAEKERQRLADIEAEKERQRIRDLELAELKKQQQEKEREAELQKKIVEENNKLQSKRLNELLPYNKFGSEVDMTSLWVLTEEKYLSILNEKKSAFDKSEKKRLDDLAKEKEKQEKQLAEYKESQRKLKEIEEKELAEKEAQEKLLSGSDKEKLTAYAATFRNEVHEQITPKTQKAKHILNQFKIAYNNLLNDFDSQINKL